MGEISSNIVVQVCAVGWEPNPIHSDHLKGLETAYNKCGWKVIINTATGVGAHNRIGKVRHMTDIIRTSLLLYLHSSPPWITGLLER